MRFLQRFFSSKPVNQSSQTATPKGVSNGDPVAVISRTDPMTGHKQPISAIGRPATQQALPSERFDARPGYGYRAKTRNLS